MSTSIFQHVGQVDLDAEGPWDCAHSNEVDSRNGDNIKVEEVQESMARFSFFATMLRMGGGISVVAALSVFLLQGWSAGDDMHRFYIMLSQTIMLAAGGLGMSYGLKENKGARVFFGLSLLSIIANMFTLGALIFSVTQWGSIPGYYPGFARWEAASLGDVHLAMGAGVLTLLTIAMFSYLVFARQSASTLTMLFLFTNTMALVPVRESFFAGALAMLAVLVPIVTLKPLLPRDVALRTPEGYFAIATLFIPALIICIRSLCFYHVDALLEVVLAATGFASLRLVSPALEKHAAGQWMTGVASFAMVFMIAHPLADMLSLHSSHLFYMLFSLIFAVLGADISYRSGKCRKAFGAFTAQAVVGSQLMLFLDIGDCMSALLLIATGIAVFMAGKPLAKGSLRVTGAGMVMIGSVHQLYHLVHFIDISGWQALAALGVTTIVAASVMERYGTVIKLKLFGK